MSLRNHVLLFAAGALLAACSGQTTTPSGDASSVPASPEAVTAAPASEAAAGSEGATTTGSAYTLEDVAMHATKDDCWTAIDGVVYDLTKFVSAHPGGDDKIIGLCGKDGTDAFNGQHGSDDQAKGKLDSFEIGVLSS